MKQLLYADSAHLLGFDYPNWAAQDITGVTVGIDDTAGGELLAAQAATLFAGTLQAAASANAMSISVTSTTAPTVGKRYRIREVTAADVGKNEDVVVRDFTDEGSNIYTLNLEHELKFAHGSGEDIKGCFCTYSADLSTTTTYTKGLHVVLTWTPAGSDDIPVTEEAQIAAVAFGVSNLWDSLSIKWPTAWAIVHGLSPEELKKKEDLFREDFDGRFAQKGINVERVVRQSLLRGPFLDFVRRAIYSDAGGEFEEEYSRANKDWIETFRGLCESTNIWEDADQDGTQDVGEEQSHEFTSTYMPI